MEIHKPRPWHGWREFLKEYGIIVLGVLTALAAEQVVDALRWAHEIADARQALGREISYNLKALTMIKMQDDCAPQRLDELQRWAEGAGPKPAGTVRGPVLYTLQTSTWEVVNSGQVVAHFPLEQKLRYALAYGGFHNVRDAIAEARVARAHVDAIATQPTLDATDLRELRQAIGLARITNRRRQNIASLVLGDDRGLAIDAPGPRFIKGADSDPATYCSSDTALGK